MNSIGNLIWLIFGGIFICIEYVIAGFAMMLTVIGIPWGLQCFKLAAFSLWPFGREIREKEAANGCLNTLLNIIWIFIGGIWICLTHLLFGLLLAISIIGLPFAMQHFKLMHLAFTPFGKEIV